MSRQTRIDWTDAVWNPVTGCDRVSPGCARCYARRMAKRLKAMRQPGYQRDGGRASGPGFGVTLHPERLGEPLRWKKAKKIFVCSMGDLFHEAVPDEFVARVLNVMLRAERHTFQVLTKRPERARRLLNTLAANSRLLGVPFWPLPNVWLGVSVENQRMADQRLPLLLDTAAAIRFISCEPLLGPLGLRDVLVYDPTTEEQVCIDALAGEWAPDSQPPLTNTVAWVIAGAESGPKARPMDVEWARSLRDQCQEARVPYFLKQAVIDGKLVKMPELDGKVWAEWPK